MIRDEILKKLKEHEGKTICIIRKSFSFSDKSEPKKWVDGYAMKDIEQYIPDEDKIKKWFYETWIFQSTYINISGEKSYWEIIIADDYETFGCLL